MVIIARRDRWGSVVPDHKSGAPFQIVEHHITEQIRIQNLFADGACQLVLTGMLL